MKAFILGLLGVILAGPANSQDDLPFKPLPRMTLNVNPLGLLQFGPIIQGEFRLAADRSSYIVPHVRIPYLGVLYHAITIDDRSDETTVSPLALGLGGGYKALIPVKKGAWYVGGAIDYSFGSATGNDAGGDWESRFSNIAIMSNGGFRWRPINKKHVFSLGAYLGAAIPARDEWWYVSTPDETHDERQLVPMIMLELSFGWEK